MRTLTTSLKVSKNTLHSGKPWVYLVRLKYRVNFAADNYSYKYYTNYNGPIVHDSKSYEPFPLAIGEIEENSKGETTRFQLGISNVGTEITNLLDDYWLNIEEPLWYITLWLVDATQPSETPLSNNEQYTVVVVTTTILASSLECIWTGLTIDRTLPARRFTKSGGFPFIPLTIR